MCIRTKTSYGCGHVFKSTDDCHSSSCSGIGRYHYMKEGDCRDCKAQGVNGTRGREGKGRYAQNLKKSKPMDRATSSSEEVSTVEGDASGILSPWAPGTRQEKTWESPHRKQADEAWVSEHGDRLSDLQERLEKVRLSERRSRSKHGKEIVLEPEEYVSYDDYDQDDSGFSSREIPYRRRHVEAKRRVDNKVRADLQPQSQRDRQHSHDSLPDSMPSYRSSPKLKKAATYHVTSAHAESSHDYDYYNPSSNRLDPKHYKRHRHSSSRANTEPYPYPGSFTCDSDYEITPLPPPLHMSSPPPPPPPPIPVIYDSFYSQSASGSPCAPYTISDYRYETSHYSSPRTQHYIDYRRY